MSPSRGRPPLAVERLEPRDTPAAGAGGILAVGADAGGVPEVRLVDAAGNPRGGFLAYDAGFRGGVRVAAADITGDGTPDYVTAPGPGGGPLVRVFDGASGTLVGQFFAYDPEFRGGVNVDVGRLDGRDVIVTGAGIGGGPHVIAFDARTFQPRESFYAYAPAFRGGVTVAVGDVLGDGRGAIVTAPGAGGGPHVKVFEAGSGAERVGFFAYAPTFTGGLTVAAGGVANLGRDAIVTGAGPRGGPQVNVFDALDPAAPVVSFFAYTPDFRGGVNVAVIDAGPGDGDTLVTGAGVGGGPQVNVYDRFRRNSGFGFGSSFFAFPAFFTGGLAFGGGYGLYDPLIPGFDPFFGPDWFYADYGPPVFLTEEVIVTDTYFTDPYFLDPGFVDPGFVDPGFIGPVFVDPGYYDPFYDDGYYYDPYYFDPGYGYYDDGFGWF